MILPLRHENMSARRWPVITLALIVINFIVFLLTFSTINDELQTPQTIDAQEHILILAAIHPELKAPPIFRR